MNLRHPVAISSAPASAAMAQLPTGHQGHRRGVAALLLLALGVAPGFLLPEARHLCSVDGFVDVLYNWLAQKLIVHHHVFRLMAELGSLGAHFQTNPEMFLSWQLINQHNQLAVYSFTSEQKLTTKPIQSSLEFGSSPGATGCIASPKSGTGCGVAGPAGYLASAANCACGAGLATETSQAVSCEWCGWLASRASSNQTARFWGHIDIHRPCGDLKGLSDEVNCIWQTGFVRKYRQRQPCLLLGTSQDPWWSKGEFACTLKSSQKWFIREYLQEPATTTMIQNGFFKIFPLWHPALG